jgi:hypothetical protein
VGGADESAFGVTSPREPDDRDQYEHDRDWIGLALHELPAGVLWGGVNGATAEQCATMLAALDDFAALCERLGLDDHADFIDACRWHFDHYPHYLGRRRHFAGYASYVRDRHGPERVASPPSPRWAGPR